jgi:hypothetical protein
MKMKNAIYTAALLFLSVAATAQTPGGVSSGLVTWLKANQGTNGINDGDPVSVWNDQSPSANHAVQSVAGARPLFYSSAINGNAAIEFNGGARFLSLSLSAISNSQYTIIAVVRRNSPGSNQYFLGVQQASPIGMHLGYRQNNSLRLFDNLISANATVTNFSSTNETSAIVIGSLSAASGRSITEVKNGITISGTHPNKSMVVFTGMGAIGRGHSINGLSGQVAEIIVYNRALTAAETRQIQTYLSVKYALTIPVASHLYFPYGSFANDLAGVGRDLIGQGLIQTEGASESSDNILKVSNPSSLDDGDYWIAGNDDGAQAFSAYSGSNCAITKLFSRTWRAAETGDVGSLSLRFDAAALSSNPSEILLLVDRDNDGFNDEDPIEGVYNAPFITFNNVNIRNGQRFTLAEGIANWYAVVSGSASGPIWAKTPSGTPQAVTSWCSRVGVTIQPGVSVTSASSITCKSFTIHSGAQFTRNAGNLTVREAFTVNGSFNPGNGTVYFNGTETQVIGGTANVEFNNLQINNPGGVDVQCASLGMRRQLQINNGIFNTNDKLTLLSGDTFQGSIGPLTTGDLIGDVTIQRHHQAAANGWVNLASPIQSTTIHDWNDDLITSGFPGSDFPTYGMNNVQWYNETVSGNLNNGFVGATGLGNNTGDLRGFFAYMNSGTMSLDVSGTIFKGNTNLPVSYTNTGNPLADGWNLVANPYPSAIDWDAAGWTKTNIDNAVYVWDAKTGQYATYVNGVSNNGGGRFIPSSQSFFVMANGASPVLAISENVKSSNQGRFKNLEQPAGIFTLTLDNGKQKDQATLAFDYSASLKFDATTDAYKLTNPLQPANFLALLDETGLEYSIQTVGQITEETIIPLRMYGVLPGDFELSWSSLPEWAPEYQFYLENTYTGQLIPMNRVKAIRLYLGDEASPTNEWQIRITRSAIGTTEDAIHVTGRVDESGVTLLLAETLEAELEIRVWNMVGQLVAPAARGNFSSGRIVIDCGGFAGPCVVELRSPETGQRQILKLAP